MPWGAIASVVGGLLSSEAGSDAADAQAASSAAAIAEQRRQFDLSRGDFAPYRSTGRNALAQLAYEMGISRPGTQAQPRAPQPQASQSPGSSFTTPSWWQPNPENAILLSQLQQSGLFSAQQQPQQQQQPQEDEPAFVPGPIGGVGSPEDVQAQALAEPGYQFGLQQGQRGIDRKIAAAGGRVSGAAIKAAGEYATNYATTKYDAAYGRRQDRLARLQTLAGLGQSATAGGAALGGQSTNAISSLMSNQGDNAGNAALYQGSVWGNAINRAAAGFNRQQPRQGVGYGQTYQPLPEDF